MPLLEVKDAEVRYGGIVGISGLNLTLEPGQFCAILGPNGAGKSSALRAITGQGKTRGTVTLGGRNLSRWPPHRRVRVGLMQVPQGGGILKTLSVSENLLLGGYGKGRQARSSRLDEVFAEYPRLYERRSVAAGLLSGGEQQMLAMGRALMAGPRVLLLDEPTVGLSPRAVREAFERVNSIRLRGIAVILVDQNAPQAMRLADSVCVVGRGHVVYQATAEDAARELDVVSAHLGLVTADIDARLETAAFDAN